MQTRKEPHQGGPKSNYSRNSTTANAEPPAGSILIDRVAPAVAGAPQWFAFRWNGKGSPPSYFCFPSADELTFECGEPAAILPAPDNGSPLDAVHAAALDGVKLDGIAWLAPGAKRPELFRVNGDYLTWTQEAVAKREEKARLLDALGLYGPDERALMVANGLLPKQDGGNDRPELPRLQRIIVTLDDLTTEPPAPPFLIEGYMPKDVQCLVGTGGTGKSTLDILQSIHLILGRPLWDMDITEPGPVVFITGEDGETRLKWRLFHIVNQLGLSHSERQQVANHFHIVNLVGTGRKLVAQDRDGNLAITPLADQIIDEFLPIAPVRVSFDPMVKFGPGERMVNDGEDMLVNAGHRINQEMHCAVNFVHHVSKDVMRNGTVDHHSGRGGSALGDGVRAAYHLLTITPELSKGYPGIELYRNDLTNGRLLALHITKLSDAPRPHEPLILRRNGWLFEPVVMPEQRDVERALEAARQRQAQQNVEIVAAYLKEHAFTKLTRRNLEDMHEDVGIPRNAIRGAITKGLMERTLIEVKLPPDEQHGAKKTYLTVAVGGEQ